MPPPPATDDKMTLVPSLDLREPGRAVRDEPPADPPDAERAAVAPADVEFDALYDEHFAFVWRTLRRLGVDPAAIDDAVQDVFVVVHRRLATFEGRSSLRTWLFGIVLRVARDQRRSARRKRSHGLLPPGEPAETEAVADPAPTPLESAARSEALRLLHDILDELDDDKREVIVMADLELMTVPEIAEGLGVNANTVYSRLRAARAHVEQAMARHRARDGWRQR
jgi:RNA polymerase sigma-70 factor, ECF subfamily